MSIELNFIFLIVCLCFDFYYSSFTETTVERKNSLKRNGTEERSYRQLGYVIMG